MSPGTEGLARFLRDRQEKVVATWLERLKEMLSDPELARAELRDHIPDFVRGLIAALSPGDPPESVISAPGSAHGTQRFRVGFDLREVVSEYGLLQEVVLELAAAEGLEISFVEMRDLSAAMNRGIAEAVSAFAEERRQSEARQAGKYVAFISHELRNPLGGALLSLDLLDGTALDERQTRFAALARRNLNRLRGLIDQVLTAERLAVGGELARERVAVASVVDRIAEEAALAALSRNVDLRLDVPADVEVTADVRLLESIASNLLQNAIKFSSAGGTIAVRARCDADGVLLEFEDSCGGLEASPEELFRPFVRAAQGEDRGGGFGLGLAIVRQAVEAHDGTIDVTNRPGIGCTFAVFLPASTAPRSLG
jgi:signal transduction histidine kinase